MPRKTINFDTVRNIGLALPGVEESTAYGQPALKIHGKLLACVPANRSAEPGSLVIRVDFDDRAELLAADPDVYYVTDHYAGYSAVLVRLLVSRRSRSAAGLARHGLQICDPQRRAPFASAEGPQAPGKKMNHRHARASPS